MFLRHVISRHEHDASNRLKDGEAILRSEREVAQTHHNPNASAISSAHSDREPASAGVGAAAPFEPHDTRRNVVTEGIDVHALLGQELVLGWLLSQALRPALDSLPTERHVAPQQIVCCNAI